MTLVDRSLGSRTLSARALTSAAPITTEALIWLRAEDLSSSPVATWPDISGNGNDFTQATGANQPTLQSNVLNGFPVVRFDGVNDALERSQQINQPSTVAVVARPAHATDAMTVWGGRNPAGTSQVSNLVRLDAAEWSIYGGSNLLSGVSQAVTWFVVLARFNGASGRVVVDSTAVDGDTGTRAVESLRVGCYVQSTTNNNHWNGDIAEVVVWPRALADSEMNQGRDYLALKYAL